MLYAFSVSPIPAGAQSTTAWISLDAPAPPGGSAVSLSTTNCTVVGVPSSVTVPAGEWGMQTTILSVIPTNSTSVTVSATRNGSTLSNAVTLTPPLMIVTQLSISPSGLIATGDATGTVQINGFAPSGGADVDLSSPAPATVLLPPFVTVPQNTQRATFTIHTALTTTTINPWITAWFGGTTAGAQLSVGAPFPPYVSAVQLSSPQVTGGASVTGTVQMNTAVTQGGVSVTLASDSPAASVPSSVTVRKGNTSATFTIRTFAQTTGTAATISATSGAKATAILDVLPSGAVCPTGIALNPSQTTAGTAVIGTVSLSGPAPAGGALVTLGGSRSGIVMVPSSVTVAANTSSATFTITTSAFMGSVNHAASITATYGGITVSTTLVMTPKSMCDLRQSKPILCASASIEPCLSDLDAAAVTSIGTDPAKYSLYTPELQLLAETERTTATPKSIAHQYVWFGGQPVASIDASSTVRWYATDHLGTPYLQTDAGGAVVWRAEYTPYGDIYGLRTGTAVHQPLRLPGQVTEDGSEIANNVFRWYRAGWGRFTQTDPIGLAGGMNTYRHADDNPTDFFDLTGLYHVSQEGIIHRVSLQELDSRCRTRSGGVTGGACTFAYATATCSCICQNGTSWQPDTDITIHVNMYIFAGNWPNLLRTRHPHDTSVRDYNSAERHENEWHIDPALAALATIITAMETPQRSQAACGQTCQLLQQAANREFSRLLGLSQQLEESGQDPRAGGVH